jgi:hypothetical protein
MVTVQAHPDFISIFESQWDDAWNNLAYSLNFASHGGSSPTSVDTLIIIFDTTGDSYVAEAV